MLDAWTLQGGVEDCGWSRRSREDLAVGTPATLTVYVVGGKPPPLADRRAWKYPRSDFPTRTRRRPLARYNHRPENLRPENVDELRTAAYTRSCCYTLEVVVK